MKPTWDQYFLGMADYVATRSSCLRRQVGAVLVKDHRILTTGYNGLPNGLEHCTSETCVRITSNIPHGGRLDLCDAVHAEQNAIIQGAYIGVSVAGSTMYTQGLPCRQCTKIILNAGIHQIIFRNSGYDDSMELFRQRPDVKLWMYKGGKTRSFHV